MPYLMAVGMNRMKLFKADATTVSIVGLVLALMGAAWWSAPFEQ